jgi:hypothetical protein
MKKELSMNNENSAKPVLGSPKTAEELLEIYFLDMRSALLETAAAMDRIERSENGGDMMDDPRVRKLNGACEILKSGKPDRVKQILRLLSDSMEQ